MTDVLWVLGFGLGFVAALLIGLSAVLLLGVGTQSESNDALVLGLLLLCASVWLLTKAWLIGDRPRK